MASKSESTPNSIGTFAKQFQDFDGVKDFLNSMTITAIVDLPFVFLFLFIIYLVGGVLVIAPLTIMVLMIVIMVLAQPKVSNNIQQMSQLKSERSGLSKRNCCRQANTSCRNYARNLHNGSSVNILFLFKVYRIDG
ncbi:hypothetical protein A3762_12165 [Oleiphilus sp. HI0125]|uniref:hypothetical protein n=1 Tax=Oleiphilus sp. HI0125 TaxID=1822266 RepID=UPI0007C3480F|nr:hypothetical protein [Oleiphilus sp. HI0125]KZZ55241.1 hypothetical protein A3762_12165 [Oleiphilus sp. HI0125]